MHLVFVPPHFAAVDDCVDCLVVKPTVCPAQTIAVLIYY